MIVQCDKCHQQFDVPDAILQPNGRNLKCAGCGQLFFQAAPDPSADRGAEKPASDPSDVKVSQDPDKKTADPVKITHDLPTAGADPDQESLAEQLEAWDKEETDGEGEGDAILSLSADLALDEEETPRHEDPDHPAEAAAMAQEPEHLAEVLDDLQTDHPEEEPPVQEEEADWATTSVDLEEIDIDGDPELRALEALEAGQNGSEGEEAIPLEPEEAMREQALEEETDTQLATQAGRVEEGALTEREAEESAATQLATHIEYAEDSLEEEDEDAMVATVKETFLPMGEAELLPEEDEPWPDEAEEEEAKAPPPAVAGKVQKREPQFDMPGKEGSLPDGGLLVAGPLPEGGKSPPGPGKPMAVKPPVPGKVVKKRVAPVARDTRPGGMSSKMGIAAALLLALTAGIILRTDWWEYAWFNWHSPYRLSTIETSWRKQSFGHLLLVQGEVANNGSTPFPPWVHVSLLDGKNNPLVAVQVVPGRVVDKKILDGSGEQAIQAMIHLQSQERTPSESTWSGKQVPFQAIFVNPPGDVARFQVDFSGASQMSAQQKDQKTGPAKL